MIKFAKLFYHPKLGQILVTKDDVKSLAGARRRDVPDAVLGVRIVEQVSLDPFSDVRENRDVVRLAALGAVDRRDRGGRTVRQRSGVAPKACLVVPAAGRGYLSERLVPDGLIGQLIRSHFAVLREPSVDRCELQGVIQVATPYGLSPP